MPRRTDIENILKDDLARAREAYEDAKSNFNGVTADIPSGLPSPDGAERIRNAGNIYGSTMNLYSQALREFNDFITAGRIPERLRNKLF